MNKIWGALLVTLALAAYCVFWPVPIEPIAWNAPTAPGYRGAHATNTRLLGLQDIALNGEIGPEHVLLGPDGKLYAGVESGRILRMQADGSAQEVFSDTKGRPLGMAFDSHGALIVADALKGLLSIASDGKVTVLATAVAGTVMGFVDAVVVAKSGKIYFTDASMRFSPAQWGSTLEAATLDVLEQAATGRVLEYDPTTKAVRVVARGSSFANGIALSGNEQSLIVCESGRYRLWKIAIGAEQLDVAIPSAQAAVFFDNLPGYPDNLMRGLDGKIWLGFGGARNDLDAMAQWPSLRRLVLRIPRVLWSQPKPYGHVMAFTDDGKVVADLQDPSGKSTLTTGATETQERLYLQNANGRGLGWIARSNL